jgi:hypothetical protein
MNGFSVVEPKRPGVLRRLVGSKLRENAFIEIQNLLATKPLKDLSAAEIVNILSTYEISRDEAMPTLLVLYEQALGHHVRDLTLLPEEREALKQLRYVLDLDEIGAIEVEATVLRATYRDQLKQALNDQHLSEVEKQKLERMADNFTLTDTVRTEIYKEEALTVVQEAFNRAVGDRRLTAEEETRLMRMIENLGVTITHDAESQRLVERFKLLARIDTGDLPTIQPPILLQRGEVCHAEFPSALHELRTVTKRINYSGPSGRIRIMKGLSWRYGSVSVSRVTAEEWRRLDSGVLYITNKRLLFNGQLKNVNTQLKKIIHFTVHKDGIQIEKDSGRDQVYLGAGDLELTSGILEAALRAR